MRFTTADTLPLDALTRLWNRGYAGYLMPVDFSAERMRAHLDTASVDLSLSPVLLDDDEAEPAGFSLLGVRGGRCWVGGLGLAPEARGRGLSHGLFREQLDRARSAGLARLHLEVLVENEVARRVYAAGGLETTRRLVFLEGTLPGGCSGEDGSEEGDASSTAGGSEVARATIPSAVGGMPASAHGVLRSPRTRGEGPGKGGGLRRHEVGPDVHDVPPAAALPHLTGLHRAWPAC